LPCDENNQAELAADGFIIVSDEDYAILLGKIQVEYDDWALNSESQIPVQNCIHDILDPAMIFGLQTMKEFISENILLGITQMNMTSIVREYTGQIAEALNTGSLYDAINEMKAVPIEHKDAIFITDERLLRFVNKVENYLKIPLSETL
jgi:hypothetical protein